MGKGRKARQARRAERQNKRASRKELRIAERTERKELRQAGRTERVLGRQATKQTAYEHGIDPNAWIADSIGSAADAVGTIYGGKFSAGKSGGAQSGQTNTKTSTIAPKTGGGNTQMIMMAGGAFLVAKMLKIV